MLLQSQTLLGGEGGLKQEIAAAGGGQGEAPGGGEAVGGPCDARVDGSEFGPRTAGGALGDRGDGVAVSRAEGGLALGAPIKAAVMVLRSLEVVYALLCLCEQAAAVLYYAYMYMNVCVLCIF